LTQTRSRSLIATHWGQIAQSVEQRIENPRVGGSIPSLATMISSVKSWCYPKLIGSSPNPGALINHPQGTFLWFFSIYIHPLHLI
jgi:hypothetical protein